MHLTHLLLLTLASTLATTTHANPTVTIHNTKPWPICLKVESSSGTFPTTTTCGGIPGLTVSPYATAHFTPSANFNGALTPIENGILGTRFEINFSDTAHPGCTWYDADMELGLSPATIGPSDNRQRLNNNQRLASLAGEQDPLAKANAAWLRSPNRWRLLAYPKYIVADKGARLVWVYNDKAAPQIVQAFFQLEAGFLAYMGPGSVAGQGGLPQGSLAQLLREAQDQKTWFVDTQDMTVTVY